MKRFATGLVVGKFAPLHRGHLKVIEAAQAACERLILLSYSSPELPGCEPERRAAWLAESFPDASCLVVTASLLEALNGKGGLPRAIPRNEAEGEVHREFVARLCATVFGTAIDAVYTSEDYGPGFAAHLTQFQQARDTSAPVVTHVSVDPARRDIPISATAIRRDPWTHWGQLSRPAARSWLKRVVFLGGESTGKSTLAFQLARVCRTRFVAEYGRELWEQRAGLDQALTYPDFVRIATEQIRREDAALASHDARAYVFCDTSPLTTYFYCQHLFGRAEEALIEAAARPYDVVFLCEADFPFEQDGTRQGTDFQALQQQWYAAELQRRGIPFQRLGGALDERIAQVLRVLTP